MSTPAENRAKWVEALRSGEFKQGTGRLRLNPEGDTDLYCCLGVACELAARAGVIPPFGFAANDQYGDYGDGGEDEELPEAVKEWLGLTSRIGRVRGHPEQNLPLLNDQGGYSFNDIAALIESGDLEFVGGEPS